MVQIELQPLAKTPQSLATYLDLNLRRLRDAISVLGRIEQFTADITGTVTVDTGIPTVKNVVATLNEAPSADACLVVAKKDPDNERQVIIEVYKNDFTLSIVPIEVNVVVVGDEPPNRPTRSS